MFSFLFNPIVSYCQVRLAPNSQQSEVRYRQMAESKCECCVNREVTPICKG